MNEHETTLTTVLSSYAEGGFAASFEITPDAYVECLTCGGISPPSAVAMSSLRRLEGESDPADTAAVVALTCPLCRARGTAVLGYGPAAPAQDADVLGGLHDERGDDVLPANSAPGETTGDETADRNG